MADITVATTPGEPIEGVAITTAGDTALASLTITYSTTVFTSNELVIRGLENIIAKLEGHTFPPTTFTP